DRLEVLWGPARHIEHVRGWRAQLERAALVILNVVANATEQIDREAAQPCTLHEQPSRRRHEPDGSPNSAADGLGHVLRAEELWTSWAVAVPAVPRRIHQCRDGDARDILVGRRRVAAIAVHPGKDAEICGQPNRCQVGVSEDAGPDDRARLRASSRTSDRRARADGS